MTREECIAALEDPMSSYGTLARALEASLAREAKLLGNGERLFDMALVRNRALEEAAQECDRWTHQAAVLSAHHIRALMTPPDARTAVGPPMSAAAVSTREAQRPETTCHAEES